MTWFKFEKALKILTEYWPVWETKKPALYHSVRVWVYLWNNNYSEDLQISGLLHDALEDTYIPESLIENEFWIDVLNIVKANSKDRSLSHPEVLDDIVKRCSDLSQDAMIVKISDIYDNFKFYVKSWNYPEIERCKLLSKYCRNHKKDSYNDKIFLRLDEIDDFEIK